MRSESSESARSDVSSLSVLRFNVNNVLKVSNTHEVNCRFSVNFGEHYPIIYISSNALVIIIVTLFQVKVQESANVLTHLCSIVMSIGLTVLVFGQSYSSMLLWLYGGSKLILPLPVLLLRAHCLAVLLLGINGVTECYTNATADSATINKSNLIMVYESIAFLGASYLFAIWFGPVGFIFGNCVNMSLRIVHSAVFINRRYQSSFYRPLRGLVPKPMFSGSLLVAALVTNLSHVTYSMKSISTSM